MSRLRTGLSVKFRIPSHVVQPDAIDSATEVQASNASCQYAAPRPVGIEGLMTVGPIISVPPSHGAPIDVRP